MNSDDSLKTKGGMRRWWVVLLLVVAAAVCMLLFFFPRQPGELRALATQVGRFEQTGKGEVFPGSGMLLGLAYGYMEMYGVPAEFYADFAVCDLWPKEAFDSVRVWITEEDYDRLMRHMSENDDKPLRIRAYRVDVQSWQGRWSHYVAAHPHGEGGWAAAGALAGILAMVLFVKKLFYES